jgi:hypothetical protein
LASRVRPVCWFVTITLTPAITAPLVSRTVPVIWPVAVCAPAVDVMSTIAASARPANVRIGLRLITVLLRCNAAVVHAKLRARVEAVYSGRLEIA